MTQVVESFEIVGFYFEIKHDIRFKKLIMLSLATLRDNNFSKEKTKKKKAITTCGVDKAVKVFGKNTTRIQ